MSHHDAVLGMELSFVSVKTLRSMNGGRTAQLNRRRRRNSSTSFAIGGERGKQKQVDEMRMNQTELCWLET